MKTYYTIISSDIKGMPWKNLPHTHKTRYRSFNRAKNHAKALHKQNRDVILLENNEDGMVAQWEYIAGQDTVIYDDGHSNPGFYGWKAVEV